jgi:hypothetical protein
MVKRRASDRARRSSVFATAILAAGIAGCGVTLPTPPSTTTDAERLCVLECQSRHSAGLSGSPYLQALQVG